MNKIKESLLSVLPITIGMLVLHFTIAPLPYGTLALFLIGAVLLIIGMSLFNLGADTAMTPMGEHLGASVTKSRRLTLLIIIGFLIGTLITIAEPDLQVLARQVSVPNMTLILTVSVGVGIFLVFSLLRIIFQMSLRITLLVLYAGVFILGAFVLPEFLPVAFDSGGVTTGPITVPFILAFGIGVASVRGGKNPQDDSFGLVGICSVGPILSVLVLSLFYSGSSSYTPVTIDDVSGFGEVLSLFVHALPEYMKEVAIALLPIAALFFIFQFVTLKLPRKQVIKIGIGLVYTYLGLVLFLTGVNVGFMQAGNLVGRIIGELPYNWILVPIGLIIGFFVLLAEPAVHVLNKNVEEVSEGAISKISMLVSLSLGVGASIGLSMLRILTGLSLWYFIIPGYAISLILSIFVPPMFTAIAFDSGGVASGPMTATFILPFAMGVCEAVGRNPLTHAFGVVAMVAMTPLITIQIMGLITKIKQMRIKTDPLPQAEKERIETEDTEIIDL